MPEYTLKEASEHILAAVRTLRAYYELEGLKNDPDDPHGQYILSRIKSLQRLADKLSPPKEVKDAKILQFIPRGRGKGS